MTDDTALRDCIQALEQQLLDPCIRADRKALERLLADEFIEFGSSGRVFDRAAVIVALSKEAGAELSISEFRVIRPSPASVLATYRTTAQVAARAETRQSLRSSLWVRRSERWQMVFHQGTPSPMEHA